MHTTIDMRVTDYRLEFIFLIACSLAVALVLPAVLAEIEWIILSADQSEFLEGRVEDGLLSVKSFSGLQFIELLPDHITL